MPVSKWKAGKGRSRKNKVREVLSKERIAPPGKGWLRASLCPFFFPEGVCMCVCMCWGEVASAELHVSSLCGGKGNH